MARFVQCWRYQECHSPSKMGLKFFCKARLNIFAFRKKCETDLSALRMKRDQTRAKPSLALPACEDLFWKWSVWDNTAQFWRLISKMTLWRVSGRLVNQMYLLTSWLSYHHCDCSTDFIILKNWAYLILSHRANIINFAWSYHRNLELKEFHSRQPHPRQDCQQRDIRIRWQDSLVYGTS